MESWPTKTVLSGSFLDGYPPDGHMKENEIGTWNIAF